MGAIDVIDVALAYGDLRAVDGVSFTVAEGEFFGILTERRGEDHDAGGDRGTEEAGLGHGERVGPGAMASQRRPVAADRRATPVVGVLRCADRTRADPHLCGDVWRPGEARRRVDRDRKSTRLNSSH